MESSHLHSRSIASFSGSTAHHERLASVSFLSASAHRHPLLFLSNSAVPASSLFCGTIPSQSVGAQTEVWRNSSWSALEHMRCASPKSETTVIGRKPPQILNGLGSIDGQPHLNGSSLPVEMSADPLLKQALSSSTTSLLLPIHVRDKVSSDNISSIEIEQSHVSPRRTLYLVDVHPLCYEGKKARPTAILNWMKLLFDQVSLEDPVIAVMDGERGNDYRKGLLPSYKKNRNKYRPLSGIHGPYIKGGEMDLREAFPYIKGFLTECNVPVLKLEDAEADDVIATLVQQAVNKGMRVVIASPDMDYRQLLSHRVKMVLPVPEFGRWSFYTLQQYTAEHGCDPSSDLGLRCMLGDQSDNVPGLQEWSPGFGRKTSLKLMKKHGSLENLLLASKTRTVGKPYIQEALAKHRDDLYRNLQVLSLRRDLDITLKADWCLPRDRSNEFEAFKRLREFLQYANISGHISK